MGAKDGGKRWTDEEKRTLKTNWLAWYVMGVKLRAIKTRLAKRFGRSVGSVAGMASQMKLPTIQYKGKKGRL